MERRIKIIQVIADAELGGGAKHVLGLLEHLDKDKFECFLVCPSGWLSSEAKKIKGVEVCNLAFKSKFNWVSIIRFRELVNKFRSENDPFGPVIIHSHGPRAGLVARLVAFDGAKSVYTEHLYDEHYHLKNPINNYFQRTLLRRLNFKTDLIIAVSQTVKEFLIKSSLVPRDRIVVISNGINIKQDGRTAGQLISKEKIIIGTIGNLNWKKGQKYLIEAFPGILEKFPRARLEIIGEGPEKENIKYQISSFEINERVAILGRQEDVQKYLKHWDVFVLPSLSETFGIVLLEAMACSVPVVASGIGGIMDIIKDKENGLLVKSKNPVDIAEKVIRVLSDQKLAGKLVAGGFEMVKEYGWDRVIKKIEEAYSEVIDR